MPTVPTEAAHCLGLHLDPPFLAPKVIPGMTEELRSRVHPRFMTLRAVSKACMLWRLSMTDLQVWLCS